VMQLEFSGVYENSFMIVSCSDRCLVCGDGQVVGNPDAIFEFPGQPVLSCELLQEAGLNGLVPLEQCPFLPGLIVQCECEPG